MSGDGNLSLPRCRPLEGDGAMGRVDVLCVDTRSVGGTSLDDLICAATVDALLA